jgi:peptide/nickel transport system substrate-binding protein
MQTRNRSVAALAGFAALAVVATACGGSSSGGTPQPSSSNSSSAPEGFKKISVNGGGTPVKGGTLNVLGTSDTDYLDPNVTYYSLGYTIAREFSRQLYTYPASSGHQTDNVPDLATGAPQVSADGLTYKITLKTGVKWNTSPPRDVTAADVVRGTKTTCNPSQPFGGLPNFDFLIQGMTAFCKGFAKVQPNAAAIKAYTENTPLSGVTVDPSDPQTVIFKLTQPATYFPNQLTLPAFSPRPIEMEDYVPASSQAAQHTISDGPYVVSSYQPTKSITFTRNSVWDPATDSVRKAYVDKIIITMTDDPESAQKQLQTGTPAADLFMGGVPSTDTPGLLAANGGQGDPNLNVESEIASNPYVLFNTQSPNNGGALKKPEVRQALSYALNRAHIIQDMAGPKISPPLTHVLPPQIHGSVAIDLYPYSVTKAQSMLQTAGVSNLTLKFLYRPSSPTSTKIFQTVQADLQKAGIKVKGVQSPDADFYTKYLQVPSAARHGVWDLSLAGWGPDWYGNAALSFFGPLFDGRVLPPTSSNFGLFNDATVNGLIDQAKAAKTEAASNALWGQADKATMQAAAFFPLSDPNEPTYHAAQVHNYVYMPEFQTGDFTNVWLETGKNGG